jgi:hypothetical protein
MFRDADIAAIVDYERELTAENARTDYLDPTERASS